MPILCKEYTIQIEVDPIVGMDMKIYICYMIKHSQYI